MKKTAKELATQVLNKIARVRQNIVGISDPQDVAELLRAYQKGKYDAPWEMQHADTNPVATWSKRYKTKDFGEMPPDVALDQMYPYGVSPVTGRKARGYVEREGLLKALKGRKPENAELSAQLLKQLEESDYPYFTSTDMG